MDIKPWNIKKIGAFKVKKACGKWLLYWMFFAISLNFDIISVNKRVALIVTSNTVSAHFWPPEQKKKASISIKRNKTIHVLIHYVWKQYLIIMTQWLWQLHNNKCAGIGGDFEKFAEMYMFTTLHNFVTPLMCR